MTLAAAIVLLARLWLVFHRLYDPDELQHLHAGFSVWQGQTPYRDFFEQHQPVLWYLSLPLFGMWGASLDVLFAGRVLIWLVGAFAVGLTWFMGNRYFGRFAGPVAALLLLVHPPYQEKNVEWRPDNIAVPLVLIAILCLDRVLAGHSRWWSLVAGASLAASFFCTQKVIYVAGGVLVAALFACRKRAEDVWAGTRTHRISVMGLLAGTGFGAAIVVFVASGFFYWNGALAPYVQQTLIAPLDWQTREPMSRFLVNQLASGAVLWGASVGGWILVMSGWWSAQWRSPGAALVAGGAFAHTAGLLHVPAAFHQYYLPLSPLVALLAAHGLTVLAQWESVPRSRPVKIVALGTGICVAGVALGLRTLVTLLSWIWIVAIGVMLAVAAALWLFRFRRTGVLIALVASIVGTVSYHMVQFQWDHESQTRRIRQLMQATEPTDAFFDGFTGYGALRPHAFKYFWINHHSWPMVPLEDKVTGVVRALEDRRTRVVLYDKDNLARFLPGDARQVIQDLYEIDTRLSDFPSLLVYVRRDRPLTNVQSEALPASNGAAEAETPKGF
jgi:uncharacterized membrane protein